MICTTPPAVDTQPVLVSGLLTALPIALLLGLGFWLLFRKRPEERLPALRATLLLFCLFLLLRLVQLVLHNPHEYSHEKSKAGVYWYLVPMDRRMAMQHKRFSIKDWAENLLLSLFFKQYYPYARVSLEVKDFASDGPILDIGGGGEGVIGRLKGSQVVAIDLYQEELDEAPVGPQKLVMDARQLTFPKDSFGAATAFFSLMYMKTPEDHKQVMKEAWRVLKPRGHLRVWEIDLANRPQTKKERYIVRLRYRVGNVEKNTAYGARWPDEERGETYYRQLAREADFEHLTTERVAHFMFLEFIKPG